MPGAPDALGERFRAAREARGLSLADVSDQIRIRTVYLAAIEDENWNTIGAPVYVRGFIRTYARFLGIDPEEAVSAFNRTRPAPPAPTDLPAGGPASRGGAVVRGSALVWVASVVAVLLIAFVVYNELTMRRAETTVSLASNSAQTSGDSAASPAAARSISPARQASLAVADQPKSLALVLSATSWLRVTVDGNVSMEGTFPAGTSKTFHGKDAVVRLGNAGGVEVYVDGRDLGKLGKSGDVVEQAFTL